MHTNTIGKKYLLAEYFQRFLKNINDSFFFYIPPTQYVKWFCLDLKLDYDQPRQPFETKHKR